MLELRPGCECCDRDLPPDSAEARICSFECTFCATCAEEVLGGRCPNCGGELVARPRRPAEKLATLKIRERITTLVETRIALLAPNRESLRRALALLALPTNAPHAAKLGWRAADLMWKLAGDTATDYNHYTKRAILAGIYSATLAVFVNDDSEGKADTHAFLERRIDGVMKFEKVKAQFLGRDRELPSLTRFLGRLRYPAR